MVHLSRPQVDEVVNTLIGTTIELEDAVQAIAVRFEELDEESVDMIENRVLQCDNCGYWDSTAIIENNAGYCEDCDEEMNFGNSDEPEDEYADDYDKETEDEDVFND